MTFAALGGRARLLTALGPGPVAALVRAELTDRGVEVADTDPDGDREVPVAAIAVDARTGTRSVISPPTRSAGEVPVGTVPVDEADVVLVDGHHAHLARAAARTARQHGIPVVVDAGRWKPVFADLFPLATAVVASADLRFPAGAAEPGFLAVTAGAAPVRWWHDGRSGTVDVPAVDAVDTLGAGDAFHGAYAYAVAGGAGLVEGLPFAVRVASLRVTAPGPREWLRRLRGVYPEA